MAGPAAPAVTIGVDADAPAVACDARRDVCWAPAAEDSGPAVWGAVVSQAPDETAQPHRGQGLVAAEPDGQPASVPGAMAIRSSPSAASAIGLLLLAVLAAAAVAVRRLHRVR